MYWQAMRNTAGSRAPGKWPRLQESRRQESIHPSLKVITEEQAGRRKIPEDGNLRVGRVCKMTVQEHLPAYRLQLSRQ